MPLNSHVLDHVEPSAELIEARTVQKCYRKQIEEQEAHLATLRQRLRSEDERVYALEMDYARKKSQSIRKRLAEKIRCDLEAKKTAMRVDDSAQQRDDCSDRTDENFSDDDEEPMSKASKTAESDDSYEIVEGTAERDEKRMAGEEDAENKLEILATVRSQFT